MIHQETNSRYLLNIPKKVGDYLGHLSTVILLVMIQCGWYCYHLTIPIFPSKTPRIMIVGIILVICKYSHLTWTLTYGSNKEKLVLERWPVRNCSYNFSQRFNSCNQRFLKTSTKFDITHVMYRYLNRASRIRIGSSAAS